MDKINKFLLLMFIYIFAHTEIFIDYILKYVNNTINENGDVTTIGEIIRFIIIFTLYILIELFFE